MAWGILLEEITSGAQGQDRDLSSIRIEGEALLDDGERT